MLKLALRPDSDGYTFTDGDEVIATKLDGGSSRIRRDKLGAYGQVSLKWTMNPKQYEYWRAFYATGTKNGSLPFLCDLVGQDGNGPQEHECTFVPGSVSLPTQTGLTYVQQATLEVKPLARDVESDGFIIEFYPATPEQLFNALAHLVNETMPEQLYV